MYVSDVLRLCSVAPESLGLHNHGEVGRLRGTGGGACVTDDLFGAMLTCFDCRAEGIAMEKNNFPHDLKRGMTVLGAGIIPTNYCSK